MDRQHARPSAAVGGKMIGWCHFSSVTLRASSVSRAHRDMVAQCHIDRPTTSDVVSRIREATYIDHLKPGKQRGGQESVACHTTQSGLPILEHRLEANSHGFFGVKAASSVYPVPGRGAAYVITWAYVLGWTAWLLEVVGGLVPSVFLLRSYDQRGLAPPPPVQAACNPDKVHAVPQPAG
jgi:hypothetical protein